MKTSELTFSFKPTEREYELRIMNIAKHVGLSIHDPIFKDIISGIPFRMIKMMNAKVIATMILGCQRVYQKAYDDGITHCKKRINDYLGVDFWSIDWSQVDLDSLPRKEHQYGPAYNEVMQEVVTEDDGQIKMWHTVSFENMTIDEAQSSLADA